jgi:hypothetical protein
MTLSIRCDIKSGSLEQYKDTKKGLISKIQGYFLSP